MNRYERGSGAKLNTAKSEAMWLGRWRANGACPFGLKWVHKMRILGVHFSNGLVNVDADNWKSKLDKLKQSLGLWSQRDLSFIGRGMIVNFLGASRFWHVSKVLLPRLGFVIILSGLCGPLFGNQSRKWLVVSDVVYPPPLGA